MKYRIEYFGRCSETVSNSNELIKRLKNTTSKIADIRKLYKSGVSDSVYDKYKIYSPVK